VLKPALVAEPVAENVVARCLEVVRRALVDEESRGLHWTVLGDYVLDRQEVTERARFVASLNPELWDFDRRARAGEPGLFPRPVSQPQPQPVLERPEPGAVVTVDTGAGPVEVAAGSLAAMALNPKALARKRFQLVNDGRMSWSLGAFGDLLWMVVPASRSFLVELACEELADAQLGARYLQPISDAEIAHRLRADTIETALAGGPGWELLLGRCFAVLRRLLAGEDGEHYRGVFDAKIRGPLLRRGGRGGQPDDALRRELEDC
jgi:hypothetical protein